MMGHEAVPFTESDSSLDPTPWGIWRQWLFANSIGELVGLGLSAMVGVGIVALLSWWLGTVSPLLIAVIVVAAGVIEGVIVGVAQWLVLQHLLPHLPLTKWVKATAAGAFIAWALGMVPSTLIDMGSVAGTSEMMTIPPGVEYLLAAGMGAVLGPILGVVQWWVLREYVHQAWWWIAAQSLAWAAGMTTIFLVVGVLPMDGGMAWIALAFALAGLVAGGVVGAIHGLVLIRLRLK